MNNQTKNTRKTTGLQTFKSTENQLLSKLPPQATDLEEDVIATCLTFDFAIKQIPFLKAEHFYKDSHQIIFQALIDCENQSISAIINHLKKTDELELVGGAYALSRMSDRFRNVANLEYFARIIQQMFIKREIIRVSGVLINQAFDNSTDALELFNSFTKEIQSVEDIFTPEVSIRKIISSRAIEAEHMDASRKGARFTGLTTGYDHLDDHFRFKYGNFVIINGHDNVGKTFVIIHLAVCANKLHGWKWLICCLENSEGRIRQDIIQARTAKHISALTDQEYDYWYKWAEDNFFLMKIDSHVTAGQKLNSLLIGKLVFELCHVRKIVLNPKTKRVCNGLRRQLRFFSLTYYVSSKYFFTFFKCG